MAGQAIDERQQVPLHRRSENEPEREETQVDFVAILLRLRRFYKTILTFAVVFTAAAVLLAYVTPPRYISAVSFIPPAMSSGSSMSAAIAGQLSSAGIGDLFGGTKSSGDLYAGVLHSRTILGDLVKRFNLMRVYGVKKESDAEKVLSQNTTVYVDPKSTIVTLTVACSTPGLAQQLAQAYMDALSNTEGQLALTQASQRRLFFGQQLAKEKDDLEEAEVELKKTQEASGLIAPVGQTESEIKTIADTQAQIALRQVQLAALRESATEQNPSVIRLRSEIDDLQGQLSRLRNGKEDAEASAIPTSKVPELQLEYVRREREVKYHEALYDMLSRQYEAARLDEAHEAPVVQMLDPASYPDRKSSPNRKLLVLGGLFAGVFVGCVWVLLRDSFFSLWRALAQPL